MSKFFFVLCVILAMLSIAFSNDECIYSGQKCQCMAKQAGGMCLRYKSGTDSDTTCETYVYGSGYVCDCEGSKICDISDCSTGGIMSYRATGKIPTAAGQDCGCEPVYGKTCLIPRPSPSSTSSTSPSVTSTVSTSPTISSSPSPSQTPTASVTPTISTTATTTATPSVTPSPSSIFAKFNETCATDKDCAPGLGCSCLLRCQRMASLEISAIGDDSALPMICGKDLGEATTTWYSRGSWKYNGPCNDLYFKVSNSGGGWSGLIASVKKSTESEWYTTKVAEDAPIQGLVTIDPEGTDFFSNSTYDFKDWKPVVKQTGLTGKGSYVLFTEDYGPADVWTYKNAAVPNGITWYKMPLPFC